MPFNLGPGELAIVIVDAAILAGIIYLLLLLVRALARSLRSNPDPRTVLAARLARGEISRDEFDTAMRALGYWPQG